MPQIPVRQEKDKRYDRQLRLWGDHGQQAIENARVCLIRAGATGAEILKNLVLPGIKSFTVVDEAAVTPQDVGNSFFVSEEDMNKPRAQVITEYLCELNDDVTGNYVVEDVNDLMENEPQFFLSFSVVIVTDAREGLLIRLSQLLDRSSIPLIVCNCVGMIGYLRVSTSEHVIIESHPDSSRPDLRLDHPLPAFVTVANEMPLSEMSSEQLSHTPWLIIVHYFVQKFISLHGHFPKSHKEKTEVKNMIAKEAARLWEDLCKREPNLDPSHFMENFEEACRAVNTAVCPTEIPPEILKILQDDRCDDPVVVTGFGGPDCTVTKSSFRNIPAEDSICPPTSNPFVTNTNFWRLVRAMRDFIANEGQGQLPLRGSLPDMISDSKRYLRLLAIYRERSEWAVECLASRLTQFPEINLNDIRIFVKNAEFLRVVRCRSLEQEMKLSPARSEDLTLIPTHQENDTMLWYIVLRGASSFLMETGRWPGSAYPYITKVKSTKNATITSLGNLSPGDESMDSSNQESKREAYDLEADLINFRNHLNRVLRAFGIASNRVSLDYLDEMIRFGGGELHSVAAFMGGIVAQEAIKLITHQFVPVTKPLIYNAISQKVELLDF